MTAGLHKVHVRVNDASTGKPTPVRIRLTGSDGTYYPPFGRLSHFAPGTWGQDVGGNLKWDDKEYAYIDGTCEVNLPAGPITVEVSKGPEYAPLSQQVVLGPGKLALRLVIERWADLRAEGWHSGDTWSHFLSPHAALLEGAAEGLAVVNLLALATLIFDEEGRQYPAVPNILAFSGQQPALEAPGHLVVVNTLNAHAVLGRLALLNCHRAVYPLSFGGPAGWDDWTLADWCDQCHRKGGLVIGHDFFGHDPGYHHGELLADIILGKVDALELNSDFESTESKGEPLGEWHQLLGCGFRVPLVCGSDKRDNLTRLGWKRTYARLKPGEPFTYKNWIEAVRLGRTFSTNGPLLRFTVNGQDPGAVLDVPATQPTVHARADARSLTSFSRIELVANGEVVAGERASGQPAAASVEAEVALPQGGWLAARCLGPYDEAAEAWVGAQSSPVYVRVDGKAPPAGRAALAALTAHLDSMREWVVREARCPTEKHRAALADVFGAGRAELLRRAAP
jgi:hypothetical protein